MARHDIVTIGASAGGVRALVELLPLLPADLRAAVFVVVHRGGSFDYLADVLGRRALLPVVRAADGDPVRLGRVYVAPPQAHLIVGPERIHIDTRTDPDPSRTGVDTLFESAAWSHAERVIAVLLSGALDDGVAGLWSVRQQGGLTIVQDPASAQVAAMPKNAMRDVPVHYCLPVRELGAKLVELIAGGASAAPRPEGARVLIVEDERIVAANLEQRLVALGYRIVGSVSSGEDALERLDRAPAPPDVVLMDVQLAGALTGTAAARQIWERFRVPIVFLTAYSDERTVAEAKLSRPSAFVVKPYLAPQVHSAIQLALDRGDPGPPRT